MLAGFGLARSLILLSNIIILVWPGNFKICWKKPTGAADRKNGRFSKLAGLSDTLAYPHNIPVSDWQTDGKCKRFLYTQLTDWEVRN